ncbi:MAG: NAD(P)/FAD-dependent oxidoreductase [Gemmatimonadaceae bacterium]|nr:NAD(P)/FAD-dependent oxidoreductase [Acetobacteraceae bacterium]
MTDRVECVVIGAGVVGLATARALALSGREVWVLEAAPGIGTGASSRNSEVVHAGIYYPAGSLKARFCVQGKQMLYEYCTERGIGHSRLGKLIVASDPAELPTLDTIRAKAAVNGVHDLETLDADETHRMEPALRVAGALLSPSTGIVDSHAMMLGFQGDIENAGGAVVCHAPILAGAVEPGGYTLQVGGPEPMALSCEVLVNAVGLDAPGMARRIHGIPPETIPQAHLCKGSYYSLSGRAPFQRLVYPVPEPGGLGVHLTLDLGGQARFGPDVQWIDAEEYDVDIRRADGFYAAIRRYWPGLPDGALTPGYAGIRPKISGPGEPAADFVVSGPAEHGLGGLVNLFGIESPGLTSSMAIGQHVEGLVNRRNAA